MQHIPETLSSLQRLKTIDLDGNRVMAVPSAILRGCTALATLSLHDNPITPEALQLTEGFAAFEARRRGKDSKGLASGVLLGRRALDEGVDRPLSPRERLSARQRTA